MKIGQIVFGVICKIIGPKMYVTLTFMYYMTTCLVNRVNNSKNNQSPSNGVLDIKELGHSDPQVLGSHG